MEKGPPGKTWQITPRLRILRHPMAGLGIGIGEKLQQAWWCRDTGETEWRDVEVVMRELTPPAA